MPIRSPAGMTRPSNRPLVPAGEAATASLRNAGQAQNSSALAIIRPSITSTTRERYRAGAAGSRKRPAIMISPPTTKNGAVDETLGSPLVRSSPTHTSWPNDHTAQLIANSAYAGAFAPPARHVRVVATIAASIAARMPRFATTRAPGRPTRR